MAVFLAGLGSVLATEIGKVALEHTPILKTLATDAAVNVAKNTFDNILDLNPNLSNFLGIFGVHRFTPKQPIASHRGRYSKRHH